MKSLHKFTEDAQKQSDNPAEPPNSISAKSLDMNFAMCAPMQSTGANQPYIVIQEESGWRLEPALEFQICENGELRRFRFFAQRVGAA
jgi:hypothetical protein